VRARPHYHPEFDPAVRNDRTAYSEVAIAMMQVSQEANHSTVGIGVTVIGGKTVVGRVDGFYALDTMGNGDWFYDIGGGAAIPPAPFISVGPSISITNAPSIDKLTGLAASTGVAIIPIGPSISLSVEIDKFQDSSNNCIYTGVSISLGGTLSANPLAGAVYATATNTDYVFRR